MNLEKGDANYIYELNQSILNLVFRNKESYLCELARVQYAGYILDCYFDPTSVAGIVRH